MPPLSPENIEALSFEEIRQVLHDLRAHQVELEMQNVELRTMQADLDAAQARYFDLYDLAPVGYCTLSEKGMILEANLTAVTLLGLNRSALLKRPLSRYILLDDQNIYFLHRKQLFETGEPQTCDLRMVKNDGTQFWAHLAATAAQDSDSAPVCRVVISDITERKLAEKACKDSEFKYRSLIEHSSDVVFCVDRNGEYKFVNQVFASTFGKTPDYFLGKTFWDIYPKDQADYRQAASSRVFETGESQSVEVVVPLPDRTLYFLAKANPVRDKTGTVVLNLTHATDITDRKQAEEALLRANKYKVSILESISDAFLSLDNEMIVTYFNRAAETTLGKRQEEVVGHRLFDVFTEARGSIFEEVYSRAIREKIALGFETYFGIAPYENWYNVHVYPHEDGITVYFQVITERKRTEESLRESEERLRNAQRIGKLGSLDWNLATNELLLSEETLAIFGLKKGKNIFAIEEIIPLLHPEDKQRVEKSLNDAIANKARHDLEHRIIRSDGEVIYVRAMAELFHDTDGKSLRLMGTIRNITEIAKRASCWPRTTSPINWWRWAS